MQQTTEVTLGWFVAREMNVVPGWDMLQRNHYWAITTSFRVSPGTERPYLLDRDNLAIVTKVGCLYCGEIYSRAFAGRACKGNHP